MYRETFDQCISVRVPREFASVITEAAARDFTTPSAYIRQAIVERLRGTGLIGPAVPAPSGHSTNERGGR